MPMRIESTASVTASVTPQSLTATSATAAATTAAKSSASTTTAIDPATGDPVPPKYPWITRLTLELEQNAQKEKASPFQPARIVGETIDKLA